MRFLTTLLCLALFAVSCQSHRSEKHQTAREIASSISVSVFNRFLKNVLKESSAYKTEKQLEEAILAFIKQGDEGANPNWARIGIDEAEAKAIKSLDEESSIMLLVRKWVMENIDIATKVTREEAFQAYKLVDTQTISAANPYSQSLVDGIMTTRRKLMEKSPELNVMAKKLWLNILTLKDESGRGLKDLQAAYKELGQVILERAKAANKMSLAALTSASLEAGIKITDITGLGAYGAGCKQFVEEASEKVLKKKAQVDMLRQALVEKLAKEKSGLDELVPFHKIPADQRVTQEELDEISERALKEVMGLNDEQAKRYFAKLKEKPCRVY